MQRLIFSLTLIMLAAVFLAGCVGAPDAANPDSPDSFVYWGFFNAAFEQKEYGEGYVLEKLAREMLSKDENLRKEFGEKLKDEKFAKSPQARLNFFYERSPYFARQRVGVYPVGRILKKPDAQILK